MFNVTYTMTGVRAFSKFLYLGYTDIGGRD